MEIIRIVKEIFSQETNCGRTIFRGQILLFPTTKIAYSSFGGSPRWTMRTPPQTRSRWTSWVPFQRNNDEWYWLRKCLIPWTGTCRDEEKTWAYLRLDAPAFILQIPGMNLLGDQLEPDIPWLDTGLAVCTKCHLSKGICFSRTKNTNPIAYRHAFPSLTQSIDFMTKHVQRLYY